MNGEEQGRERARKFRAEHGLGTLPLGDLVALVELTQQVDVAILDAEQDEHGMTMRDPQRKVVMVAAARTKNPMRQRSTLAHELGHILFEDCTTPKKGGWADRSPEEIRADAFARHLLVPTDGVASFLGHKASPSLSDLSTLVQRYQASPAIVAIQLREVGLIDSARKQQWKALTTPSLAARFGWTDQYHALQQESDTRRAPQRLLARATAGYVANTVSLQAIARLRGVTIDEIDAEFAEAGITPAEQPSLWAAPDELPSVDADLSELHQHDGEVDDG